MDTESVCKLSGSKTKTKASNGTGEAAVAADDGCSPTAWYNITNADIFRNRNNPKNGVDCFFSEASFNQIMGPGPSFQEKLLSQIARIKFEQKKQNDANLNKTNSKQLEQKSKLTDVKLSKDAEVSQLPAVLSSSAYGFQDQSCKDSLTVSSGSVNQDMNSRTLDKDSKKKMKLKSSNLAAKRGNIDQDLKKSMGVNSGSQNQNVNNSMTVNSGSVNQSLNNSMTVNSGSMNQSLNNSMTVNSGSMNQSLNNSMTVNSGSMNQSLNSMTVNSGSVNQSLNSMTVNSGSVNQSLNNSMTVNDSPAVSANNKQAQLSNSDLVSNIASFAYSEISVEQKNVDCLSSVEPVRNSSNGIDDIKIVPIAFLPAHVSIGETVNESKYVSNGTNIYTDTKSVDIKHNEPILDPTIDSTSGIDEHSQCIELRPEEFEKSINHSKPNILRVSKDSLHTSVSVTRAHVDGSSIGTDVVTSSISCLNSTSSDAAYCEIATNTCTASTTVTSISLDTEANISNVPSQNSKPRDSDSRSEHFGHGEIEQKGLDVSLPVRQNLNSTDEVTHANSSYPDKRTQEFGENLKTDTAGDNTATSKDHISISISQSDLCCEEEMPLVLNIAEVPENNLQKAPLLDRDTTEDTNLLSPPQDAHELCLVMPSLSDDDNDDDDDENNFNDSVFSGANKHPYNEGILIKNELDTSLSLDNRPQPTVNVSTSNPLHAVHDDGGSIFNSPPNTVNSKDADNAVTQFQTGTQACSWENNMPDTHSMEMQSGYQQSSYENSANWQTTLDPAWSEVDIPIFSVKDIPIFSVKEATPEPVKCRKSTAAKQERKQSLESVGKGGKMSSVEDGAVKEEVNKTLGFRRSDLTRAEHATYLKLYNKYVHFFMQRGPPPVLTALQSNEIASFETLQRRVQAEQAEFQNYLLQNAKKNPQCYSFLRTVGRNYASSRAKSYRLMLNCATKYRDTYDCHIPFCVNASPAMLKFQQALLEIGVPPRIKLPDLQAGHKPVPIPHDIHKVNNSFPRISKNIIPGFTHHEHVSSDINVETLATKYDFQVVMSSSVMKCLLNNHGPEFERAWNIPVHVMEHSIDGETKTIVYLDKPIFEDDLRVKDYSTIFHKYALRTFVSHPKSRPAPVTKQLFHQSIHPEQPCEIDDPFDVSSSNVDSLETFGAGCSKLFKQDKTPTEDAHENVESAVTEHKDGKTNHRLYGRRLRSSRKYRNWDEVTDDVNQFEVKRTGNNLDNIQSIFKKGHQKKSGEPETATDSKQPVEDSEYDFEPKKKRFKIDGVDECHSSENVMNTCSSSVTMENSLFINTDDSPQSPEAGCTEPFNKTQSPLSPIASPASPSTVDQSCSSKFNIQQIPLSPVREIPSSPVMRSLPSALPTVATPLPCRRSPRTRANKSESPGAATSVSQKASSVSKMSGYTGGVPSKLFTPLDSILGPSFGQTEGRNSQDTPKEDPSHYPPPIEVHSSIVYNLWSLGSLNVLLRTRCHGTLKDLKKTRKVYFSPKMEYQSTHGLEQVTVSEMARDWTACFIRPHTNLLRVRINAFTSEILMLEELETGQILRSSLNFQPDISFQFLDRVLQCLVNLEPDHYLLSHEPGDNFCGIRSLKSSSNQRSEKTTPRKKKKTTRADQLPWVPIDPTLLLPYHIAHNRIPATFLPKDVVINQNNAGGPNKRNTNNKSANDVTDNKKGGVWKQFKGQKRGRGRNKN